MCLHYLVKLIARVLSPYITYFSIGYCSLWTFGIKFSPTVETTVFNSQQLFPSCLLTWGIMQERIYNKEKIANVEELRQRIVAGRVGTSWSAHYRRRSEGVAKTTASVCCCWRRTVWTWTVTSGATVLLQLCTMTLPFNPLAAYNICRDCFQCSLTLSVTCSRCEAL